MSTPYHKRSKLYFTGTDELYDKDYSTLSCSRNISIQGYQSMQAFYYGQEMFAEITGMNLSTLYLPHCGSDRKLRRTLDKIFDSEDTAILVNSNGITHKISYDRFVLAIGDVSSSKTIILDNYLSKYDIPIISPGSYSHWVDNVDRYRTLVRPSTSYAQLVAIIFQILSKQNVQTIGIVYSNSPEGRSAVQLLDNFSQSNHICVSERIQVDSTAKAAEELGEFLGTNALVPRVIVAFIDEHIKPLILSSIGQSNLYWQQRGRIFIMAGDIPITAPFMNLFRGSLAVKQNSSFRWSGQNSNNNFHEYLDQFSPNSASNNQYYAYFWQQHLECFMANSPFTLRKFDHQCDLPCDSGVMPTETCQVIQLSEINSNIVLKNIYLAWSALATVIHNTPQHEQLALIQNRQRMMSEIKSCDVPRSPDTDSTFRLFETASNQGAPMYTITSIGATTEQYIVFSYYNGMLEDIQTPTFYINGDVDSNFKSPCNDLKCDCSQHGIDGLETSTKPVPQHAKLTDLGIGLIALSCIFIVVFVLVVLYILKLRKTKGVGRNLGW